jgi:hypothetical protein
MAYVRLEAFYHDIPYWVLQVIRDNQTGRLYNGRNVQSGQLTVDCAMDEMMEIVQHKYKSMLDFPGDLDLGTSAFYGTSGPERNVAIMITRVKMRPDALACTLNVALTVAVVYELLPCK